MEVITPVQHFNFKLGNLAGLIEVETIFHQTISGKSDIPLVKWSIGIEKILVKFSGTLSIQQVEAIVAVLSCQQPRISDKRNQPDG